MTGTESIGGDQRTVWVLADDVSGAAEAAAGFMGRGVGVEVLLHAGVSNRPVTVVDLHTRRLSVADAEKAVAQALSIAADARVVIKIDSLLRGSVEATVRAAAHTGRPVVIAAGNPTLGRTVVGGVVLVDGVPLDQSGLWAAESTPAPRSISDAAGAARGVRIVDITSDADLDGVVAQATPDTILIGTGALTAAVARTLPPRSGARAVAISSRTVMVVGTADSGVEAQLRHLETDGTAVVRIDSADLLAGRAAKPDVHDAVAIAIDGPVTPENAHRLVHALAGVAAGIIDDSTNLVLTGGETARTVLDRLGVDRMEPIAEIHQGAIACVTSDGRLVVTRPGSFGDDRSLATIAAYLRSNNSEGHPMTKHLPYVAVTMGDGAGIGPEVIVPAMLDPRVAGWCRPVVIGDASRLRLAAGALGLQPQIVTVERISDAEFTPGRINVIDLALLPEDLAWGELSAVAGHAAYEYIRVAGELAVAGDVQAICTAPLNKEALHAAGHIFPGHTELLAHLTGTEEVSMMLSSPTLKVIHVTTHIGLLDAVAKIEPGLVERTIRRGHDALVRSGNAHPKIGVCGINPHAGENGLFGYGEEDQKIVPAVELLRAEGIDVHGPLPADTAFFLAGRGDYDLIVAMYHDQGHGPVKVLGLEAGVNITVGLPVIRTSVDHGTAFDIAGKGIAEPGSMIEALRQAAELATSTATV
ncbi:4-hydroxythreonine-4-phosphate dehydrogenase PdxA [Mycobacterium sp. AZCC_0083]|uniref:4-hydroxythreonine-4-phosphate dehydrogenase PdxA n=1 Tax=Mycobacterium sp. AZCC_0083 TaxID=2735882 RepID=UPI00181150FD|nr:4-hydroxythreonine-4-phosphate dehydrogenase PdxA [Mycobacterium sp. AZCC_0083]MBB5162934.1 4-hydroxythreonine-4-phosphate dehydrogenase [Mycobacterium sp. AZCC_0083]